MAYDTCIQVPASSVGRTLEISRKLGLKGVCFLSGPKGLAEIKNASREAPTGLLLEPGNRNDLGRKVSGERRSNIFIAVKTSDPEIWRAASENPGVDCILGWESSPKQVDYITVKLAAENGVALAFSFQPLLAAYDRSRPSIMANMLAGARFVRKYRAPLIITSGAVSEWDLRSDSELSAFGMVLGFSGKDIKQALSGDTIKRNSKLVSGKHVIRGVEKV